MMLMIVQCSLSVCCTCLKHQRLIMYVFTATRHAYAKTLVSEPANSRHRLS